MIFPFSQNRSHHAAVVVDGEKISIIIVGGSLIPPSIDGAANGDQNWYFQHRLWMGTTASLLLVEGTLFTVGRFWKVSTDGWYMSMVDVGSGFGWWMVDVGRWWEQHHHRWLKAHFGPWGDSEKKVNGQGHHGPGHHGWGHHGWGYQGLGHHGRGPVVHAAVVMDDENSIIIVGERQAMDLGRFWKYLSI